MNDNSTFINTECAIPEKVDLEKLTEINMGFRGDIISSFTGIPLKIDEILEGNQYYIAVSRELYKQIENRAVT
jgi:hypothetical protein